MKKTYKLICKSYYCRWESEDYDDYDEANAVEKCPKCGASRITDLKLVEVEA